MEDNDFLKSLIPLEKVPHLVQFELIKGKKEKLQELYQESRTNEHPFFLDAVVRTDSPGHFEYRIAHRLPDDSFPNGSIWLTEFDDVKDMDGGFGYFHTVLGDKISRITDTKKTKRFPDLKGNMGYTFERELPFDIENVLTWIPQYKKIEFIDTVLVWPRYNNNNRRDLTNSPITQ